MKSKRLWFIFIPLILIIFIWLTIFIVNYNRYLNGKTPIFPLSIVINDGVYGSYTEYNCLLYKVIKYESLYGRNDMEFRNIFYKIENVFLSIEEFDYLSNYLNEETDTSDSVCFTNFKIYGVELERGYLKDVSLFKNTSCYYEENNKIVQRNNYSIPMRLTLNSKNELKIENIRIPRNGNLYSNDMKKIFSKSVVISINNIDHSEFNKLLEKEVLEYFYPLKLYN